MSNQLFPLTSYQRGIWEDQLIKGDIPIYNIGGYVEFKGVVDLAILSKAVEVVIHQSDALRIRIVENGGEPYQLFEESQSYKIIDIDFTGEEAPSRSGIGWMQKRINSSIPMYNNELFDVALLRISDKQNYLFGRAHHIIIDGWGFSLFMQRLSGIYNMLLTNEEPDIEANSYTAFIEHDFEYRKNPKWQDDRKFWTSKYAQFPESLLPSSNSSSSMQCKLDKFSIASKTYTSIQDFLKPEKLTNFHYLLALLFIYLSKVFNKDEIVIGIPLLNRKSSRFKKTVGLFASVVPLRMQIKPAQTLLEFVKDIKDELRQLYRHSELSMSEINQIVRMQNSSENHSLFDITFSYEVHDYNMSFGDDEPIFINMLQYSHCNTALAVFLREYHHEKDVVMELYQQDWVSEGGLLGENVVVRLSELIDKCYSKADTLLRDIDILSEDEKKKILVEFNNTRVEYPESKTVHKLFEEQVERAPDRIALVSGCEQITYRQLNLRADSLANILRAKQVGIDDVVGVLCDSTPLYVVAIMAILKSGGAFMPIDKEYPDDRKKYMLADSKAKILLADHKVSRNISGHCEIVFIDKNTGEEGPPKNDTLGTSDDLAYVIYTSGSTGKPKGVMVNHQSIVNLCYWHNDQYRVTEEDIASKYAGLGFDASVWELFPYLVAGACVHFISNEIKYEPALLNEYFEKNKISIGFLPTQMCEEFQMLENLSLRILLTGGDKLKSFRERNYVLFNNYGPTENTVVTSNFKVNELFENIPIGKPIHNTRVYILNKHQNLLPIGVPGELCIGGDGLSRGYLNQPELTSEKFVDNPHAPGNRMYRTGDLARWLPDGNIEFLGRIDQQVKIRGFRIELGEIEAKLVEIEGVREAVVIAKEDGNGNKYLSAYYVTDKKLAASELRTQLSRALPEYMIPAFFTVLDHLPLTANGKVNRDVLPEPEKIIQDDEHYVPPANEIEEKLVEIWAEVLCIDRNEVSINKSFFELGGNSLLGIKLHQKLKQLEEFKELDVSDLFKYHTINLLTQSVQKKELIEYSVKMETPHSVNHGIAIIGMSGTFSGAANLLEFWQLIKNNTEGIRFYNEEECGKLGGDISLFENPDYVPVAGKVEEIEHFDPLFWGISPNEASLIDPQIRKFVEHCWFALESSGYIHRRRECNIGVFAGSGIERYFHKYVLRQEIKSQKDLFEASTVNSKDALATRVSFMLGLTGPANSINTACSTSLISVIEACQKLELKVCDMALAGGVSLSMPDQIGYIYEEGMILSRDGHCRTFDENASGTTGGSGVGVVVLKRLQDAVRDNDRIIGVIKGYASNNDGDRKVSYTAPSVPGQADCIIKAQKNAGVTSNEIDYVECHGTATNLGDPIEVQALREAFQVNQANEPKQMRKTVLGAVKANIGHTDSAAGIAGLIKVCLMLQNRTMVGQPNFDKPNSKLNIEQSPFEISKGNRDWFPSKERQRLAGVSSFGIGGTNAHVIVADYASNSQDRSENSASDLSSEQQKSPVKFVVPISAKSKKSHDLFKQKLLEYIVEESLQSLSISDLAYTLQERREHFNYRSAYCAQSVSELIQRLRLQTVYSKIDLESKKKIVFMFPGQGSQYVSMARELYDNDQYFKKTIDQLIAIANQNLETDLYKVMYQSKDVPDFNINETQWTQISLFIIEYALVKYLEHLGIKADAFIGHSLGEYTAATLSGVFSLEDAIKVVIARGKLMQSVQLGSMLAVEAKVKVISEFVERNNCEIALVNSMDDIVVAGNRKNIQTLKRELWENGIASAELNVSHACHSRFMDQIADKFTCLFENVKLNSPSKPFVSNLSGEIAKEEVTTVSYWYSQLRNTVQFANGIACICKHYNDKVTFIDIGLDEGLSHFVNKYKRINNCKSIDIAKLLPSINEKDYEEYQKIESKEDVFSKLWACGIIDCPNDMALFEKATSLANLPSYQFNHKKCWLEDSNPTNAPVYNSIDSIFYGRSWERRHMITTSDRMDYLKQKNILILISNRDVRQSGSLGIINALCGSCDHAGYVLHKQSNSVVPGSPFDLCDPAHMDRILREKTKNAPIDMVLYVSSTIDMREPAFDIFAVKNLFDCSEKIKVSIPKFVSISFDNYDVTGSEILQEKPSIVYGITKSIPFDYFSMDTKVLHVDLSSRDSNYENALVSVISRNCEQELIVPRGKFEWFPTYPHTKYLNTKPITNSDRKKENPVFLISGGLGGVGFAYADYLVKKEGKCTLVLIGRTTESNLRHDYKERLLSLRESKNRILYCAIDIAADGAARNLEELLVSNGITSIDIVLHAAGIGAKSAINGKSHEDIARVVETKVLGVENILKLTGSINIECLVCCSSLTSIVPSLGNMEYTSANMYLDELCYRSYPNIGTMVAINLNQISDTGMAIDFIKKSESKIAKNSNSIKSHDFPVLLETVLQSRVAGNIMLSRYDVTNVILENKRLLCKVTGEVSNESRIKIVEKDHTEGELKIAQIWSHVLGIEEVSVHDNFFQVGGNSLNAITLISHIRKTFERDVKLGLVFSAPTVRGIAAALVDGTVSAFVGIPVAEEKPFYPASSSQRRLYVLSMLEGAGVTYNMPAIYEVEGCLDRDKLSTAFENLIRRHEPLRTSFMMNDDDVVQIVHEDLDFAIEYHQANGDGEVKTQVQEFIRPFDLIKAPLIRVGIIEKNKSSSILMIDLHHIISDGVSTNTLVGDFLALYNQVVLDPPKLQFKDYAVWENSEEYQSIIEKEEKYWLEVFKSEIPILDLPTDYQRPSIMRFEGTTEFFTIDREISNRLREMCKEDGNTLYMVLLSAFAVLLHKYSGQNDIVVGTPVSGRTHVDLEKMQGMFVNTLALRLQVDGSTRFSDFLKGVKKETITAFENQNYHFETLVEKLKVRKDTSRNPLFNVMFALENMGNREIEIPGLTLRPYEFDYTISKFDLTLGIMEKDECLVCSMEYSTNLFKKETIERIFGHFVSVLGAIICNDNCTIDDIDVLTPKDKEKILQEFNDTQVDYPNELVIQELFEMQVECTPDKTAVVFGDEKLSYRELNERANSLAWVLLERGVRPDDTVGLMVERSFETVIGILGILKAGGAYVPIDHKLPVERMEYIIAGSSIKALVTKRYLTKQFAQTGVIANVKDIILLDDVTITGQNSNPRKNIISSNAAYVIYTSGTTGTPKGVVVEHRSAINTLLYRKNEYRFDEHVVSLQLLSYSFDGFVTSLFTPLISGGVNVFSKENEQLDIDSIIMTIRKNKVTHFMSLPVLYQAILERSAASDICTLKTVTLGGDNISERIISETIRKNPNLEIAIEYGITECAVVSTICRNQEKQRRIMIGKPIQNTHVYIVDKEHRLLPIGVPGEICIAGDGLARGYINQPKSTTEKFIDNPYAPGNRMYKTGDLARWLPDGNIEFLGRIDYQVKIRGFRIELGEIEANLAKIEGVRETVVIAREASSGDKYLVAYYVAENKVTASELRSLLIRDLPEYMIPAHFICIEGIPLTINGKVDRSALPEPAKNIENEVDYVAPVNEIQDVLVDIWAEVLDLDRNKISINKSFFELGGNSLLGIKLQQRLNEMENFRHISVSDLFKYHTIRLLAQSIQDDGQIQYKLQDKTYHNNHEVAIIGMSGAFSGASNIFEFWDLIKNQEEGIRFYSKEECQELGIDTALFEYPEYIPVAGQVKDIDLFDTSFWEVPPSEANLTDPQIRKFIEHCWFALESSGYVQQRKNCNIGVFAGSGIENYFYRNVLNGEMASKVNLWEASIVNSKDSLATRTSYLLGLSGPANSINTSCSTSLVSVVEACHYLQSGSCDMALAGGVSLCMPDQIGYTYQEGMISSRDGHCRTFDERASGTTGGSGVGVVLLKRLEDALRDNDKIIGVIKGYGTNNDGDRKASYTAPSVAGQVECIINAQRMAGVSSNEIDYVECHGTGTNLGDPIEVQALMEAFENNKKDGPGSRHKTVLGAVKANIGHADSAAGIAGLIKVCLMLENQIIPGQANFCRPNPKLNIDRTSFRIATENQEWHPDRNRLRLAGVSSFGIGGTNAHVIIGDYATSRQGELEIAASTVPTTQNPNDLIRFCVPVSAKSEQSFESYKQQLIKYLAGADQQQLCIRDLTYTLQERREHFKIRRAYRSNSIYELIDILKQESPPYRVDLEGKNRIVFMFPGQGSQYTSMARELYENEEFFRKSIDKLILLANKNLSVDLRLVMFPATGTPTFDINETLWAQIALLIIEYSLARYLEHLGIIADAYIGHSIGEYTAATLSGVFSLEDAIKVVVQRGKLMQSMKPGSMLALNATVESIRTIIEDNKCEVAAINSVDDIVVSGDDAAIRALKSALDKGGIPTVVLNTSHAYHSKMMEVAAEEFESVFSDVKLNKPDKVFISNLTGEIAGEEVTAPDYWCKHLRNTVKFADGISHLCQTYHDQVDFIEVGPGKGLSSFVGKYKKTKDKVAIRTIQLLRRSRDKNGTSSNEECCEDIVSNLWGYGIIDKPNDNMLFANAKMLADLPTYQFEYRKCWLKASDSNRLNRELRILPKEKWLYTPVWSAVSNLKEYRTTETLFRNALVIVRKDQLMSLNITCLAATIHLIVLDVNETVALDVSGSQAYSFNMKDEDEFKKLAEHIKNRNTKYDAIVHASSINNVSQLTDALNYSFYSLYLFSKYLLNSSHLENLLVLTNGLAQITNEDILCAPNGTLVGAVRNINHEFPNVNAMIIDVGDKGERIDSHVFQVVKDKAYTKSEELLAVRFGKIWKESFERIENLQAGVDLIEDGDIILVTGGLGGVALAVASHVSERHKVTFVLVSRRNIYKESGQSDYMSQKIGIIERIKANGSIIDIHNCDISDEQQVAELSEAVEQKHGRLHGVIHTAGVPSLTIDKYSLSNVKEALKAKVHGIHNVINAMNLENAKFLVFTSSLASVMGDVNRIEYCASNSFLDYLAANKMQLPNIRTLSINLPGWSDIGMIMEAPADIAEEAKQTRGSGKVLHLNSVKQHEGADIFYQLVNQTNYDQIIVSKLDIGLLKSMLYTREEAHCDDIMVTIKEENLTEAEYKIAQIWCRVLGIGEISIYDNFFDLGGNSLNAIAIISELQKENYSVSMNDIFLKQTIRELASHICAEREGGPRISEGSDVHAHLLREFDREVSFFEIVRNDVSGMAYRAMYVHTEIIDEELLKLEKYIGRTLSEDAIPHYIITPNTLVDFRDETYTMEKIFGKSKPIDPTALDVEIGTARSHFERTIVGGRLGRTFSLSPIQQGHLELKNQFSGTIIPFDSYLDISLIELTVFELIKTHGLLRSILREIDGRVQFVEFELSAMPTIPTIDLSGCYVADEELQRLLHQYFIIDMEKDVLPYRLVLVRRNLREHYLILAVNHLIYDRMSFDIIKRDFVRYYKALENGEAVDSLKPLHYQDYVEKLGNGPIGITQDEVMDSFRLEEYGVMKCEMEKALGKGDAECAYWCEYSAQFDGVLNEEQSFEIAFAVAVKLISQLVGQRMLPVNLVYNGRKYQSSDFHNTVGEFLDLIPLLVDGSGSVMESCQYATERIQLITEKSINFMSFLFDKRLHESWHRVADVIRPNKASGLLILFNFTGKNEVRELDLMKNVMGTEKSKVRPRKDLLANIYFDVSYTSLGMEFTLAQCVEQDNERITELFNKSIKEVQSELNRTRRNADSFVNTSGTAQKHQKVRSLRTV